MQPTESVKRGVEGAEIERGTPHSFFVEGIGWMEVDDPSKRALADVFRLPVEVKSEGGEDGSTLMFRSEGLVVEVLRTSILAVRYADARAADTLAARIRGGVRRADMAEVLDALAHGEAVTFGVPPLVLPRDQSVQYNEHGGQEPQR